MTPLETKATNEIERATQQDELTWLADGDEYRATWRGIGLMLSNSTLYVQGFVVDTYDPAPLLTKIENKLDREYKHLLRTLSGGGDA